MNLQPLKDNWKIWILPLLVWYAFFIRFATLATNIAHDVPEVSEKIDYLISFVAGASMLTFIYIAIVNYEKIKPTKIRKRTKVLFYVLVGFYVLSSFCMISIEMIKGKRAKEAVNTEIKTEANISNETKWK